MKTFLHTTIACLAATICMAQTNVNIEILHKLDGGEFSFGQTVTSPLNEEYEIERLEYYLSGFSISYDGGQETTADDLYVLAYAGEPTLFNFGTIEANHIDAITFFIGVDKNNNHIDPSLWPSDHPLAPKNPSMHWGWTAGYRFLAFEGTELASNQLFQLHGLEDNNYFSVTLPIDMDIADGDITIQINGNYDQILNNISIADGPIVHGGYGRAQEALENMASDVFEYNAISLGVSNNFPNVSFNVFPNPAVDGLAQIIVDGLDNERIDLHVYDIVGKKVFEENSISTGQKTVLNLTKAGMYIVMIAKNGVTIATQKLVVQ